MTLKQVSYNGISRPNRKCGLSNSIFIGIDTVLTISSSNWALKNNYLHSKCLHTTYRATTPGPSGYGQHYVRHVWHWGAMSSTRMGIEEQHPHQKRVLSVSFLSTGILTPNGYRSTISPSPRQVFSKYIFTKMGLEGTVSTLKWVLSYNIFTKTGIL